MPDQDTPDGQLEERLARAFAAETRRADAPARELFGRARAAADGRRRRDPTTWPARSAAAVVAVLGIAAVSILVLARPVGPRPTGTAVAASVPVGSASGSADAAGTAQPAFDADGVPLRIDGEPVLRGSAIIERAQSGDPAPFLVAGWSTIEPQGTCAPSPWDCNRTHLVDGPGPYLTSDITLHADDGSERLPAWTFPYSESWAGGFYVLRVRATCTYWGLVCLFVDGTVPPSVALPSDSAGYDADGVPLRIDGQPVYRGTAIADQVRAAQGTPFYAAGWPTPLPSLKKDACTDPLRWDVGPCLRAALADPGRGVAAGSGVVARGEYLDAVGTLPWTSPDRWTGGYVVLRVVGHSSDSGLELRVQGVVGPGGGATSQVPMPTFPSGGSMGWSDDGIVTSVEDQRVWTGTDVLRGLDAAGTTTILVQGRVERTACAACGGVATTVLVPPRGAKALTPAFPVLRADGSWFEAGSGMIWQSKPFAGTVVVEVRRWAGACPARADCTDALEVVSVVAPADVP
jgi:hypothetical protein